MTAAEWETESLRLCLGREDSLCMKMGGVMDPESDDNVVVVVG